MKIPRVMLERGVDSDYEGKLPLQNVFFDAPNKRLIASDGHMLVRRSVETEEGELSGMITKEVLTFARASGADSIRFTDTEVEVWDRSVQIGGFPRVEGKYPETDSFFTEFSGQPVLRFNLAVLVKAVAAMKKFMDSEELEEGDSSDNYREVAIWPGKDSLNTALMIAPIVSGLYLDTECVAVMMPIRTEVPTAEEVVQRGANLKGKDENDSQEVRQQEVASQEVHSEIGQTSSQTAEAGEEAARSSGDGEPSPRRHRIRR
jgi:hypothetical protein